MNYASGIMIRRHVLPLMLLVALSIFLGCASNKRSEFPRPPRGDDELVLRFKDRHEYKEPESNPFVDNDAAREYLRGHRAGWEERASDYRVILRGGILITRSSKVARAYDSASRAFRDGASDGRAAAEQECLAFKKTVREHYRRYLEMGRRARDREMFERPIGR